MFRTIKIVFNATIIVLAFIGFNAIGGQKYVEGIKDAIGTFIAQHNADSVKKIGDFSKNITRRYLIDNIWNGRTMLRFRKKIVNNDLENIRKTCFSNVSLRKG